MDAASFQVEGPSCHAYQVEVDGKYQVEEASCLDEAGNSSLEARENFSDQTVDPSRKRFG